MDRRAFFQSIVSVASLPVLAGSAVGQNESDAISNSLDTYRTWHFFDLWRLDLCQNLELKQGTARWNEDATYVEPHIGALSAWPTVYRDPASSRWRMLYSANWKPYSLMIAESEDGRRWQPLPQPDIHPVGKKLAPNHLFTLPDGSGGGVYLDPVAEDDLRFKVFVHQRGKSVVQRAIADPDHRWHADAVSEGQQRYMADEYTLVSRDGLHWESRLDMSWSGRDWHPEPPIFGFYNRRERRHQMTVRPGWGDRRLNLQATSDFVDWSGPEPLLQPDALDQSLIELYGMPVFPYGDGYVGLPWIFHCESSSPTRGFNRFVGPLDCQLAYSQDGRKFVRGMRTPLIERNELEDHGGGAIQPSCLVETDDELRFYSAATRFHHGKGGEARRSGVTDNASILLHTMRKDGLTYLQSHGDWARFITKPLVLLDANLIMNAAAPHGEIRFQLTDLDSRPVEGFTLDDCLPMKSDDSVRFPIRWRSASLTEIVGRIVRLEIQMRHAQLFAFRGQIHFIDAQDRWLIEDGKPIVT